MNINSWPFLVSRNKVFDYRPVVAPSFLIERKASFLLAQAIGDELTELGYVYYREIYSSKVGNLSLIFRVVRAESHHLGLEGNEILKDQYGRPINIIEGFIVKGPISGSKIIVTNSDFLYVFKQQMEWNYREFWNSVTVTPSVNPSQSFYLQGDKNAIDRLRVKVLEALSLEQ